MTQGRHAGAFETSRLRYTPVAGAERLFAPDFVSFLLYLHDTFTPRIHALRAKRAELLRKAHQEGQLPTHPPVTDINTGDWTVPPVPDDLLQPGIEISGPASITRMFINALNPGRDGSRAEGDLDDDEDSAGHRLIDTVQATLNRLGAVERTLTFTDPVRGREYRIAEGNLPFFMHRERGLHLDEPEVTIDGSSIPASTLGTALTLYYPGRAQTERGQGIYFYLPKLESAEECAFWRAFFDACREYVPFLKDALIRAIPLIESLPAAYQMEEMLYELGPYAAGLNAARWDFKASIFEYVMTDPSQVWPDRFGVDIKTTDFLATIFRRLVAICLKRGAVPVGGMATPLPSSDPHVNEVAAEGIRADKQWEAEQGFLRGWVAHIFHMQPAAEPFKQLRASGWQPTPEMARPENYPVEIKVPEGSITVGGTRRNVRMLVEYLEGWLNGRGAKGIDSLEGKPGIHPALMEDLATGRMSVAQIAQRIRHRVVGSDEPSHIHDFGLVKRLLQEETEDVLNHRQAEMTSDQSRTAYAETEVRYRKASKIAMRWIKNYTELNFRSLGSYTRQELDAIAAAEDAF